MKKVGLLTMHRVFNYGSILQAYATQTIIESLGFICDVIDYQYPNKIHKCGKFDIHQFIGFLLQLKQGFPELRRRKKFRRFYKKYFHLTQYYPTKESLERNPPIEDVYIVGSDQTWNTRHIKDDSTFLLSFVPEGKRKLSFSSSAARLSYSSDFSSMFKKYVSEFSAISVREKNTQSMVQKLLNRKVPVTLDPTLMLNQSGWEKMVSNASLHISEPYILVYVLKYSFNPYPLVTKIIRQIYQQTRLHVVCIRYSAREKLGISNATYYNESISPEDFVYLFKNASYVVTTSFHGTAFSVTFNKRFFSIVKPDSTDDRIMSLLNMLGIPERGISEDKDLSNHLDIDYTLVNQKLDEERNKTISYLRDNI